MSIFFEKLLQLEQQEWDFFMDYWYAWIYLILIVCGILIVFNSDWYKGNDNI